MKGKTHIIGGLAISSVLLYCNKTYHWDLPVTSFDYITASVLGSLLPDIDHKKSLLGSIFHLPIKHRTLTHSLLFLFITSIIVLQFNLSIALGLFVGISSHLFLDMLPVRSKGICLFYPSKKRYSFFRIPK
jgi:inner membrane protein